MISNSFVYLWGILLLFFLSLMTYDSEEKQRENKYDLTTEIRGDRSIERTWTELSFDAVASISRGEAFTLFNPVAARTDDSDVLYVYDFGDYTVKAFTRKGAYLATYGQGRGQGPGQMMTMGDVGVWNDSLVYITDPRQRRVSFFEKDGDLVRTESYDFPPYQLAWANASIKYVMPPAVLSSAPFLKITHSGRDLTIRRRPSRTDDEILLDGTLRTAGGKAIYVLRYMPVILTYSPEDTTGIAYPTPDYGRDLPTPREGGRMAPAEHLNGKPTVSGGVLSVQKPTQEGEGVAFDLYDLDGMEYMHSVRLPIDGQRAVYAYGKDLVAAVRDTTVNIYRVSTSEK